MVKSSETERKERMDTSSLMKIGLMGSDPIKKYNARKPGGGRKKLKPEYDAGENLK